MPEAENTGTAWHTLSMTRIMPGLIDVQLELQTPGAAPQRVPDLGDEPGWSLAVDRIVQTSFAGRDICFVAYQPPIVWSDLELEHLTYRIETARAGELDFKFGFVERVSRAVLVAAAESQDFRHSGLLITAIPRRPEERITSFFNALAQAGSHFPPAKEWIRLPPEKIGAILQTQIEMKLRSNEEWIECVNDGEQINWYHPLPAALSACRSELEALAAQQGWQFKAGQT